MALQRHSGFLFFLQEKYLSRRAKVIQLPQPSHVAPSGLIGYVLMIALNGKSNLRDSVEFGFLEVARSQQPNHARRPFGCFPKGWLSRFCHGSRGNTLGNTDKR